MDQILAVLGYALIVGGLVSLFTLTATKRDTKVPVRVALLTIILGSILILWKW